MCVLCVLSLKTNKIVNIYESRKFSSVNKALTRWLSWCHVKYVTWFSEKKVISNSLYIKVLPSWFKS